MASTYIQSTKQTHTIKHTLYYHPPSQSQYQHRTGTSIEVFGMFHVTPCFNVWFLRRMSARAEFKPQPMHSTLYCLQHGEFGSTFVTLAQDVITNKNATAIAPLKAAADRIQSLYKKLTEMHHRELCYTLYRYDAQ